MNHLFEKFAGKPDENAQMKFKHTLQFYNDNNGDQRLPPFKYVAELVDIYPVPNIKEEVSYEFYK